MFKVILFRCVWPLLIIIIVGMNKKKKKKQQPAHHAMINYEANEKLDHDTLDKESTN